MDDCTNLSERLRATTTLDGMQQCILSLERRLQAIGPRPRDTELARIRGLLREDLARRRLLLELLRP